MKIKNLAKALAQNGTKMFFIKTKKLQHVTTGVVGKYTTGRR